MHMENLEIDDIESIINNPKLSSRSSLISLGTKRFGISKSKLSRLSKREIIESIKAAVNHELSLSIISEQAKQAGKNRS